MGPQRGLSLIPAGKMVFVDANIFLYEIFNHPDFGEGSYIILNDIEQGILKGVTSTLVLDEVLYKMILMEASNKFKISLKNTASFLKKNPEKIPQMESSWKDIQRIQNLENLIIEGITPKIFDNSIEIAKKNMLLTHDASHLAVMQSIGVANIATNDTDFERIEGIKVWKP